MDLSLNDTQQLIQDSARDFVRGACNRDALLKLDRNPAMMDGIWKQMSELGWTGMAIQEEYDGTGNSITDVAVLFEELGTGPVPGPLFSSSVLCARILLEAADEKTKKAWLPKIASGERVFALAFTEAQYGWSADRVRLEAKKENGAFVLNGTKLYVQDALYATDLIDGFKMEETIRLGGEPRIEMVDGQEGEGPAIRVNLEGRQSLVFHPYYEAGGRTDGAWRLTWLQSASAASR